MDLGADWLVAKPEGNNLLHRVAQNNNVTVCKVLLKDKSRPAATMINDKNQAGNTPLFEACSKISPKIVRMLLESGADCNIHCNDGRTALHMAASCDAGADMVTLLLKHGAKHDALNKNKSTPLILAASGGAEKVVQILLDAGADANAANHMTALHRAARWGHLSCVKLLVEKGRADCNVRGENGRPPLVVAICYRHREVFEYLVQLPSIEIAAIDLQYVITSTSDQLGVDLLAERLKSEGRLDDKCEPYCTALQAAAWMGRTDTVRKLLELGANPNIMGGDHGCALNAAVENDNLEIVQLLLDHHAAVTVTEYGVEQPIFCAIRQASLEIFQLLLVKMSHEEQLAVRSTGGQPMLQYAVCEEKNRIIDCLVSHELGFSDIKDASGHTPRPGE
ncbi:ankyrin repeat-containing domain protein [Bombardia bombarda]|uniref:Ankyrin repeat-containing domain protein n=1 Tax=Bombardia bombarda TaxID=252184 RepID=A0AA39XCL8_9PEZI|nr:ankyrin repeat-containing domain protein [Bombardia bombarda]